MKVCNLIIVAILLTMGVFSNLTAQTDGGELGDELGNGLVTFVKAPIFISEVDIKDDVDETTGYARYSTEYDTYPGYGNICTDDTMLFTMPVSGTMYYKMSNHIDSMENAPWFISLVFEANVEYAVPAPNHPDYFISVRFDADDTSIASVELGPFHLIDCTPWLPVKGVSQKTDISNPVEESLKFQAGPNPVINDLNIQYTTEKETPIHIQLYTIEGKLLEVLESNQLATQGTHQLNYNMANLQEGMYIINIQANDKSQAFKVYKSR